MVKQWVGCAPGNCKQGRPAGLQPSAIVIHVMEGTLKGTDTWFNDPKASVSAHYGVGKNGEVHQYVEEQDTAFHAGTVVNPTWRGLRKGINPNFYTIGIEHEGRAEDPWPWPDAQVAASGALIADIAARWGIPLDTDHVISHHSIRASKPCPGERVVIDHILARAQPSTDAPLQVAAIAPAQTLKQVNVRFQQPSTSARVVRVFPAHTSLKVAGFTNSGERVFGNSYWYRDADGNYIWAGGTDVPHPA